MLKSINGLLLLPILLLTACNSSTNSSTTQVSYALVTVANPGNESDPLTALGAVNYVYNIGKYDVTIGQYTAFLNAVAKEDSYSLYNPSMATDLNSAGISQTGTAGNYTYSVMNNAGSSANRPITYITWYDAARFANWMANGQAVGAENSQTSENGAYNLNGAMNGKVIAKNAINPNTGEPPTYYLPTYNEWYKAAYYSPELNSGAGGYYLYATQSNTTPGNSSYTLPNQVNNYPGTVFFVTQSPNYFYAAQNYLTDVGAFINSPSYYGTFDQNGNVYQWVDLVESSTAYQGVVGGYWFAGSSPMQASTYATNSLALTDNGTGFRLASPEPISQ